MKDCCCWRKLPIQRFKTAWLKSPRSKLYDRHHKFVYQFCWKRGLNDSCDVWWRITNNRLLNNHPIAFKDFIWGRVNILVIYSKIHSLYRLPSRIVSSIQVWFLCMFVCVCVYVFVCLCVCVCVCVYVFVCSYNIIKIISILINNAYLYFNDKWLWPKYFVQGINNYI